MRSYREHLEHLRPRCNRMTTRQRRSHVKVGLCRPLSASRRGQSNDDTIARMWIYIQRTGNLYHSSPPVLKTLVGSGYSGYGQYKNDPASQCFQDLGPIPRGAWTIGPLQDNSTSSGHVLSNSMRLTPGASTATCQRDGFLMHGDNSTGVASAGCIVLPLAVRQSVDNSDDADLTVVAEESDV